jgi:peroxiredoxin
VLGLLDLYRRCTFVLDAAGTVRYAHRAIGPGLGYRPVAEVLDVVRATEGN